jgi:hypothetical protein
MIWDRGKGIWARLKSGVIWRLRLALRISVSVKGIAGIARAGMTRIPVIVPAKRSAASEPRRTP